MKKILIAVTMLALGVSAHAQFAWTDTVHSVTITGYAGILAGPKVSTETGKFGGFATFRGGATVTFFPKWAKWMTAYGLGAIETDETGTVSPFYLVGTTFRPHAKVAITVGKIATPMTELRPLPTTMAGQFEPWTKSHILGSAMGGKVAYTPSKNLSLVAGGFWRNGDESVELGFTVPYVKTAGYFLVQSKTFGIATTGTYKWLAQTFSYNHKKDFASLTCFDIPKTQGVSLYADIGFDANTWRLIRAEGGILKFYSYKGLINVLYGAGYAHEIHTVRAYVMVSF